jgi:hypothetical protein
VLNISAVTVRTARRRTRSQGRVLGSEVARVTEALESDATPEGWRDLLRVIHEQHPELMETSLGHQFTSIVIGRIYERDACVRLGASRDAGHGRFN